MKIKIVGKDLFKKSNYIFIENHDVSGVFNVYATRDDNNQLLVDIAGSLSWIKNDMAIKIVDSNISKQWISIKKQRFLDFNIETNIRCPEWMSKDDNFFCDLIENPQLAKEKLLQHENL